MIKPEQIEALRENPSGLYDLSPREFEEVVAELLASSGYEVSLTPASRDGGHDILAIGRDQLGFDTAWAVQCKQYRRDRRVGVEAVRSLYGVKHFLRLPQALLATTSTLTDEARKFAASTGDIKVADSKVLHTWISRYKRPSQAESYVSHKRFQSCFVSYKPQRRGLCGAFSGRASGSRSARMVRTRGPEPWPEDSRGSRESNQ